MSLIAELIILFYLQLCQLYRNLTIVIWTNIDVFAIFSFVAIKKNLTHCKHVPCNTLTHSTNEDLLNIKRKGDSQVLYPLSYVQYH